MPFLALRPVFMRGDGLSILKACSYIFLPNMCLCVASEVTILEIPPCQTPMCGVAYSCSHVLLPTFILGGHPIDDLHKLGSSTKGGKTGRSAVADRAVAHDRRLCDG